MCPKIKTMRKNNAWRQQDNKQGMNGLLETTMGHKHTREGKLCRCRRKK